MLVCDDADVFDLGRKVCSLIHDVAEELWLRVMVDWQAFHLEVVILLDIDRPREDGDSLCHQIKKHVWIRLFSIVIHI